MNRAANFLAKNILNLRKSKNWTQNDLAKTAGIPRTTLSHIESGTGNPSLNNLLKISEALHVNLEELLSKPKAFAEKFSKDNLPQELRSKNSIRITKLIPHNIQGLEFEKLEFQVGAHMKGNPHLKGSHEYFYCLQGNIRVYVSGEAFDLKAGELLYFPGDQAHAYINQSKSKSIGISLINTR